MMAVLGLAMTLKSVRLKNIFLGKVTSQCISVFVWLHFGLLLMLENLFHNFGTVSPQLFFSEAELWEWSKGLISGAVVFLKWARPSELLACIPGLCLPPLDHYALEFAEGHSERLPYDVTRGLPGLPGCSLPLVYRPEMTILELSVKKSLLPLGYKTWFPTALPPNTHSYGDTHTVWVWKIVSSLSCSSYKVVESQIVIL